MNKIRQIKDYGYNPDKVVFEQEAYVGTKLGAKFPYEILSPEKIYKTPVFEPQALDYETDGCTVYGMENQVSMYLMAKFGFEPNYAEGFNYTLLGLNRGGANPQLAYESARTQHGLIDQNLLPRPKTFEEFKDKNAITPTMIKKGQEWMDKWEMKHTWLRNITAEEVSKYLDRCPVGIGVTAWWEDDDGYFIDHGQKNTHWCVGRKAIVHTPTGRPTIEAFDTYNKSLKKLHPDHNISVAKLIWIGERTEPRNIPHKGLWKEFIDFITDIISGIINWFK